MSDEPRKPRSLPPMPKVRKLPAMPKASKATAKVKGPANAAPMPWMPKMEDEVEPIEGSFGEQDTDRHKADDTGRWFETGKEHGQIGGRCWKCGRKRRGENLRLHSRPFGKGEVWVCKEGC